MYEKFYGLNEKPFNATPDPRFLFLSKHHQEALAHLHYGITEKKGLIVITGEVGTGKTTLIRTLLERLGQNVKTALIFNPSLTLEDYFMLVCYEFELKTESVSKARFLIELNSFLLEASRNNETVVMIIDEAQNLPAAILEEIRMLLNLETTKEKLLQVVLTGQPELTATLNTPELRQLKQRISLRYHIAPLTRKETSRYIEQRLKIAGRTGGSPFSEKAVNKVFDYAQGIPRLINIVCDNALVMGYAENKEEIDQEIIQECIYDLEKRWSDDNEMHAAKLPLPDDTGWLRRSYLAALFFVVFLAGLDYFFFVDTNDKVFWAGIAERGRAFFSAQSRTTVSDPITPSGVGVSATVNARKEEQLPVEALEPETHLKYVETFETAPTDRAVRVHHDDGDDVPTDHAVRQDVIQSPSGQEADQAFMPERTDVNGPRDSAFQKVTIEQGDYLRDISLKWYGMVNPDILHEIQEVNPQIQDINHIQTGWEIILPDLRPRESAAPLYSVHLASFKKFGDAHEFFSDLVKRGFEAYLIPVTIPAKGNWFRVTLGTFKGEKEALRYAHEVRTLESFNYAQVLRIGETTAMGVEK